MTAERDELRNEKETLSNLQTQRKKSDERQSQTDDEPKQRMTEQQIAEMVEQNVQLKTELNEREEELYRLRNDKVLAEITTSEGHSKVSHSGKTTEKNGGKGRGRGQTRHMEGTMPSEIIQSLLPAKFTPILTQTQRPPSDTDSATSNNDWERMGKE